jgi:hypothetical protein
MGLSDSNDSSAATSNLIDEIKALGDSTEELLILLEHIWQNRDELRVKVSVVLGGNLREAVAETLCCYECDTASPSSLAQALHDGWIDIMSAEEAHGTNFVGWCPACQRLNDDEDRRRNEGLLSGWPMSETQPAPSTRGA